MGLIELPQAACLDLADGLSNQKVQECSSGCVTAVVVEDPFESSSPPTISPSSSSSSSSSPILRFGIGFEATLMLLCSSRVAGFTNSSTIFRFSVSLAVALGGFFFAFSVFTFEREICLILYIYSKCGWQMGWV